MVTMKEALDEHLKIVKEHGYSTYVTYEYMKGWSVPKNGDYSYHNMYLIALDRIVKLEEDYYQLQKGLCGTNAQLSNAWATAERAEELVDGLKLENADYHDANELYGKKIIQLEQELKECYDLHEVALEMVENE